jgi:hypothetical protein
MDYERLTDAPAPTPVLIEELAATEVFPSEKRPLGMLGVRSGTVKHGGGEWVVCRAPQDPGRARLLDVAVGLVEQHNAPCLAILEQPAEKERKMEASAEYLRVYQNIAWRAFGVAFVLDVAGRTLAAGDVAPDAPARAEFDRLVAEIDANLREDAGTAPEGTRWMVPEDSREAEALVRLTMNRVLRPRGYRRKLDGGTLGKTYKGFWRGAEADGVWSHESAGVRHLALESKLTEDIEAPLCQVVDHLAHLMSGGNAGGVVCVRVYGAGRVPQERTGGMKRLEEAVLVRYLDVVLGK